MDASAQTTDVLVIGSGPLGATAARLLVAGGRRVTMIEAGPYVSFPAGSHQANAFTFQQQPNLFLDIMASQLEVFSVPPSPPVPLPAPGFEPVGGRLNFSNPQQSTAFNMPWASATYAVGGMGTHWTCCTPDPAPMERTALVSADEWRWLLPVVRSLLNVHTDAFSPSLNAAVIKDALDAAGVAADNLPLAAEKRQGAWPLTHMVTWTGVDTILGPLLDPAAPESTRFSLLAEHRAEQLLLAGHRVDGAVVRNLRNLSATRVLADTVVVAGGPLLTPSLLWRSGIRPSALGRYLNANRAASATLVLNDRIIEALRQLPDNPARLDPIPMTWADPPVMIGRSPTADEPWHYQIQRFGQYVSYDLGFMSPPTDARLVIDLIWYGMIEPDADNYVTFSEDLVDRFGQPQMTIHYQESEADHANDAAMLHQMTQVGEAIGVFLPTCDDAPSGGAPAFQSPGSTLHYQGTCRMGDDGGAASVVDVNSKVWGFDNLYLGSVGVIPNSMASNPTLTACALAVRAAAHMLGSSVPALAQAIGVQSDGPPAPTP
jgi:pyranose oxidase